MPAQEQGRRLGGTEAQRGSPRTWSSSGVSLSPPSPGPSPPILYTPCSGSLRGLLAGRVGGRMESRASSRVTPVAFPSFRSTCPPLNQGICGNGDAVKVGRGRGVAPGMPIPGQDPFRPAPGAHRPRLHSRWCWAPACCFRASPRWAQRPRWPDCSRSS